MAGHGHHKCGMSIHPNSLGKGGFASKYFIRQIDQAPFCVLFVNHVPIRTCWVIVVTSRKEENDWYGMSTACALHGGKCSSKSKYSFPLSTPKPTDLQEQYRGQRCDYCFCTGTVFWCDCFFLSKKC